MTSGLDNPLFACMYVCTYLRVYECFLFLPFRTAYGGALVMRIPHLFAVADLRFSLLLS